MELPSDPNSQENGDKIWRAEGEDTWRTYPKLYDRIVQLVPAGNRVFDVGCGVGKLLDRLRDEKQCFTAGCDISPVAVLVAASKQHDVQCYAITGSSVHYLSLRTDVVLATEILEHLDDDTIQQFLFAVRLKQCRAIFAVPNNCMGPDEEPQHRQKWTAISFKRLLESYFKDVRIECIDDGAPRLLAVCNFSKPYKLAFTMPVKNEADDLERVLKSFRGACDVMVIGVDDKSTDATEEIARRYADEVFFFTWENDFSKARNACITQCKLQLNDHHDWIFMSEGHEHLEAGLDELLHLDTVPKGVHVLEVRREDRDHAWMFPWLFRNRDDIYFDRPVHNTLVWDDRKSQVAQLPAVRTWHARSHANAKERIEQRRKMNRQELVKQLAANPSDSRSCYYLANEWRREDNSKAITYYERYLAMPGKNGPERYQARLALSQCLVKRVQDGKDPARQQRDLQQAYDTLIVAAADDWSRNEHWLYLGDLCFTQADRVEQALRFYELAAVSIGREPLTFMWIEKSNYAWVPAQKLVTVYAALGMLEEALTWCVRTAELLPVWAVQDARDEVETFRQTIMRKMEDRS